MLSTYEEIEAEWQRLVDQSDRPFPPEAHAAMTGFMQYELDSQSGLVAYTVVGPFR